MITDNEKFTYSIPVTPPKMFGIWIPGEGWLRGKDLFADTDLDKAIQVARLIGRGASVRFIDTSIVDFEERYKENEYRTRKWIISKWHIFKNYFKLKNNK